MDDSLEKKISRQVGWLNYNAGLKERISCSDVRGPLAEVGQAQAMKILKDVETSAEHIDNPTQYILQATGYSGAEISAIVARAPAQHPPQGAKRPAPGAWGAAAQDPTGKIARQVGWLNQHAGLKEKLSFSDVVGPLSELDITTAMKILKDVEEGAQRIERPTAYVTAAAGRLAQSPGAWAPAAAGAGPKRVPPPHAAAPASATAPVAPNTSPNDEDGKKIARQIGWLNQHAGLTERISYSDVKEALEVLDMRTAMRVLKDVENMKRTIRNPTAFVISTAQRAQERGSVRGGAEDEVRAVAQCWDFVSGFCPRGDKCRYQHEGEAAEQPAQSIADSAAMAAALGVSLSEQALLELSSVPAIEAETLLADLVANTESIANPDAHVSKACSRLRAEAFKGQTGLGIMDKESLTKRMKLGA